MTLEIDENAINKKLRIISDESEEQAIPWLQNDIKKNFSKPCKKVEPFPGACIKTWTENGEKVFINVCHSKEIHPPKDISEDQLHQLLNEDNPNFIIPMALGVEKMAKTKDGIERSTFDILINTNYFQKCMKKPFFWNFTIAVFFGSINDKYNKLIDVTKYVVLKNCKVMGSLDTFSIEDRKPRKSAIKKPLIEVLEDQEKDNLRHITKIKTEHEENYNLKHKTKMIDTQNLKFQNYIIVKSDNEKNLIGYFYLPSSNIKDITIDIGKNRIIVEDRKTNYIIDVFLPHFINNGDAIANYDSKLHILKIIIPLKNNG